MCHEKLIDLAATTNQHPHRPPPFQANASHALNVAYHSSRGPLQGAPQSGP